MRRAFLTVLIAFGVFALGVFFGFGARALSNAYLDKNDNLLRDQNSSSTALNYSASNRVVPELKTDQLENGEGLCIELLQIRSDLSQTDFTFEVADSIGVVKRNGAESFLIYPLGRGLNLEKEYKVSTRSTVPAPEFGSPVYRFDDARQTSYLVPHTLPFFVILLQGTDDDSQSTKDVQSFLQTMRPERCSSPLPDERSGSREYQTLKVWMVTLPKAAQTAIEDAYALEKVKYTQPPRSKAEYFAYSQCVGYILETGLQGLSTEEVARVATAPLIADYLKYQPLHRVIQLHYIGERLKFDFGLPRMLKVDGIAAGLIMMEDMEPRKESCANLPVPARYK
jgi:hypothetical protein